MGKKTEGQHIQLQYLGRGRTIGPGFIVGGLGVSFLVHTAVAVSIIIGTITGSMAIEKKAEEPLAPFTPVELIKLGVERPKKQMPRISNPAPKVAPEEVVNIADKASRPEDVVLRPKDPKPKDAKRVRDTKRTKDILDSFHNPNRPVNNDKAEGLKGGVAEGTVIDDAQRALMNTYMAKMQRAIIQQWRVPQTITRTRAKELAGQVRIYVRVSADGYVVSWSFRRRSADPQFDSSCEAAVRKFSARSGTGRRLPMPEREDLRKLIVKRGFTLTRWKGQF